MVGAYGALWAVAIPRGVEPPGAAATSTRVERGVSLLGGPAFVGDGGALALTRVEILADGAADAVVDAADAAWPGLAPDERVLFLLGYEAANALDARAPRRAADPSLGPECFAWRCRVVPTPTPTPTPTPSVELRPAAPRPTLALTTTTAARDAHLARIAAARELLLDGVIYQANLAHRLRVAPQSFAAGAAFFASRSPGVACAALVDVPGWGSFVSLSPERFVVGDLGTRDVWTCPIKGTAPRGRTPDEDEALAATLRTSAKDHAEHVMIVDLLRNDLGRVATVGGVTVERLLAPLTTPNVHHLETTIHARLRPDVGLGALLRAAAPGGSITGAPKSSAVQAIHDLEDGPRGAYTGVLGVVDGAGRFVTSLLIRTWLRPDEGPGALHVGGGIVVDSDPEKEWQETLHKARAFGDVVVAEG
jgi:anthranilate/para-aminobenzoate synthase component I